MPFTNRFELFLFLLFQRLFLFLGHLGMISFVFSGISRDAVVPMYVFAVFSVVVVMLIVAIMLCFFHDLEFNQVTLKTEALKNAVRM